MRISVLATYVAENYGFGVWRERSQQVFLARDVVQNGVQKGKVYEVEVVENPKDVTGNTPWLAAHLYDDEEVLEPMDLDDALGAIDLPPLHTPEVSEVTGEGTNDVYRQDILGLLLRNRVMTTKEVSEAMNEMYMHLDRNIVSNSLRCLFRNGHIVKCDVFTQEQKRASYTIWAMSNNDLMEAVHQYAKKAV